MSDSSEEKLISSRLPPAIRIRRGFIGEITIHQITEDELETLAHGYPDSTYLNYAIFLLSTATSFLISLLTTEVTQRTFIVFVIVVVSGFTVGLILLILWYRTRKSISALVKRIKDRLPPEGSQALYAVIEGDDKG